RDLPDRSLGSRRYRLAALQGRFGRRSHSERGLRCRPSGLAAHKSIFARALVEERRGASTLVDVRTDESGRDGFEQAPFYSRRLGAGPERSLVGGGTLAGLRAWAALDIGAPFDQLSAPLGRPGRTKTARAAPKARSTARNAMARSEITGKRKLLAQNVSHS